MSSDSQNPLTPVEIRRMIPVVQNTVQTPEENAALTALIVAAENEPRCYPVLRVVELACSKNVGHSALFKELHRRAESACINETSIFRHILIKILKINPVLTVASTEDVGALNEHYSLVAVVAELGQLVLAMRILRGFLEAFAATILAQRASKGRDRHLRRSPAPAATPAPVYAGIAKRALEVYRARLTPDAPTVVALCAQHGLSRNSYGSFIVAVNAWSGSIETLFKQIDAGELRSIADVQRVCGTARMRDRAAERVRAQPPISDTTH